MRIIVDAIIFYEQTNSKTELRSFGRVDIHFSRLTVPVKVHCGGDTTFVAQ